jgi:hypothetical protein
MKYWYQDAEKSLQKTCIVADSQRPFNSKQNKLGDIVVLAI